MEKIIIFIIPLAIFVFGMFIFNWLWGIFWLYSHRHYSPKVLSDISKYNEFVQRRELLSSTMKEILDTFKDGSYNTDDIYNLTNALSKECLDIRSLCNRLSDYFDVPNFPEESLMNLYFNYRWLSTVNNRSEKPYYKMLLGNVWADLSHLYNALNELETIDYKDPKFVWLTTKPYILHKNGAKEYA